MTLTDVVEDAIRLIVVCVVLNPILLGSVGLKLTFPIRVNVLVLVTLGTIVTATEPDGTEIVVVDVVTDTK